MCNCEKLKMAGSGLAQFTKSEWVKQAGATNEGKPVFAFQDGATTYYLYFVKSKWYIGPTIGKQVFYMKNEVTELFVKKKIQNLKSV